MNPVDNSFGGVNGAGVVGANGVAGGMSSGVQMPGQVTQPISSGAGDVIINNGGGRGRRGWLIAAAAMMVIAAVAVVLGIGAANGWFGGSAVLDDGGVMDAKVLSLMEESYDDIEEAQVLFAGGRQGRYMSDGFLAEWTRERLTAYVEIMNDFAAGLEAIDSRYISDDEAREWFTELRDLVQNDLSYYNDTLVVYDLFYNYVNNEYVAEYADEIRALGNSYADAALEEIDGDQGNLFTSGMDDMVQNIFAVYIPGDWPSEDNYYYYYASAIMAEYENEE